MGLPLHKPASHPDQDQPDFDAWRRSLAQFVTLQGMRPALEHVSAEKWIAWYEAGANPEDAALQEVIETE